MQATSEPILHVHLNALLHNGRFSLYDFQPYLEQTDFFTTSDDLKAALDVMLYNSGMLVQLCTQFDVMIEYRRTPLQGKPFWTFSCTSLPGELHRQDIKFNTDHPAGISDSAFARAQPDMGMGGCGSPNRGFMFGRDAFGRPLGTNQHVTNSELVHVLGAYALTQIHPLPPAKFRAYPAGLELLDLVRERLNGPQYTKDHMGAWQLNPEFHKPVYPGNYANERYNSFAPTNTTRTVRLPSVAFEIELFELASDTAAGIKKQLLDSEVLVKSCDEIELLTMVTEIACQLQMATFEPPADNKLYLTIGELDALPTVLRLSVQAGFNGWIVHSNIPAPHGTVQRAPSIVIYRRQHW